MDPIRFRRGKKPYTYHLTVVRIGQDGLDCDLDIAMAEVQEIEGFLRSAITGLQVLGVDNPVINDWLNNALFQARDTAQTLDRLVDKLLSTHEVVPATFSQLILARDRGDDTAYGLYAEQEDTKESV